MGVAKVLTWQLPFIAAAAIAASGCGLILGLGDYKDAASGGAGGATSSSTSSSSATTGGGGQGGQPCTGAPAKLDVDKTMQDFGSVVKGKTSPMQSIQFSNHGGCDTGDLTVQLTGSDAAQFHVATDGCNGHSLMPGQSCVTVVDLKPTATGPLSATLTAAASPGGAQSVDLTGLGILPGQIGIDPTAFDFMDVRVGQTSATAQDYVVTNTGNQDSGALMTAFNDPGHDFQEVDACSGVVVPANGGTCTIKVTFAPMTEGMKTLHMTVSGMPGGTVSAQAKGNGQQYYPLDVTISGDGSGKVTSNPAGGIDCGSMCNADQLAGTMVTLTATADPGSTFTGWSGGGCMGTAPCTVTMDQAQIVNADFKLQTVTLTVTRSLIGAASGTVTSDDGMINCPGTCSAQYLYGTSVTLNALPGANYYLKDWSGGITSTQYSPTFAVNGDMTVKATFTPPNKVFVSTKVYTGNIGGPAAANLECNTEASAANIAGNYVAWLSTSTTDASSLLANARGWVRPDNAPFGDTVADITGFPGSGHVWYPPRLTAAGNDVGAGYWLASGTSNGNKVSGFMCGDWTSTSSNSIAGLADTGLEGWSYSFSSGCSGANFHLLCFQTDYQAVVYVTRSANTRTIFLSSTAFSPAGGYMSANQICQMEAAANSLSGTYQALMATSGASAASHFTTQNKLIVRPDGVIVASDAQLFTVGGGAIVAPIEVGANGQQIGDPNTEVFTGATTLTQAGTSTTTCNNWTTNSGAATGISGLSNYSAGLVYFNNTRFAQPGCDAANVHVYCLQQ